MYPSSHPRPYDALVVGARCAGASTAMLLARRGLRVLAIDRGKYGSDALSTHALMRTAVVQLSRWGLLDAVRAAGTPAIRATTFHYGDEALPIALRPRDGVDALYAPRRTVLDALLVDAARQAGAEVRHGVRLERLLQRRGRVVGAVLREADGSLSDIPADLVIGADGLDSRMADLVGADNTVTGRHATALVYGYWADRELAATHWYFRPGVGAGAIPTNGGLANVFVALPPERYTRELVPDRAGGYLRALAAAAPELAERLSRTARLAGLRVFPGRAGFLRRSAGPGWALVGDAGYFKDPLTAHGISDALRDAELLARAAASGGDRALGEYQTERDELSREFLAVTDQIASLAWDLAAIKELHLRLRDATSREAEAIGAFDRGRVAA